MFTDLTLQRHLRRVAAGRPAAAVVGVVADTASGGDPEGTYELPKRRALLFSAGKLKIFFRAAALSRSFYLSFLPKMPLRRGMGVPVVVEHRLQVYRNLILTHTSNIFTLAH